MYESESIIVVLFGIFAMIITLWTMNKLTTCPFKMRFDPQRINYQFFYHGGCKHFELKPYLWIARETVHSYRYIMCDKCERRNRVMKNNVG
jgi:hypothetical protein